MTGESGGRSSGLLDDGCEVVGACRPIAQQAGRSNEAVDARCVRLHAEDVTGNDWAACGQGFHGCATPQPHGSGPDAAPGRASLVSRWLELTRRQLPGMAAEQGWPIRLDHCFMRVCLDASFGRPWHERVARPAIRHASDADLTRAIAVAEAIVREPGSLPGLNAASLRMRGKRR